MSNVDFFAVVLTFMFVSAVQRDNNGESHRPQNNNTEVEHAFITRRQISDHNETVTPHESPEVIALCFLPSFTKSVLFYNPAKIICYSQPSNGLPEKSP